MLHSIRITLLCINYTSRVIFLSFSMDTSIKPTIFATLKH